MDIALAVMTEEEVSRCRVAGEESGFGTLATGKGHLPLRAMDIQATLEGLLAQVDLAQTFVNTFDEPLEATYIFPLPDRAAVTKFRLDVGDRVVEGVLEERGAARRSYDQALVAGHQAAIAEEDRPGVFTLRVGNLMPGASARVRLSLSSPLLFDTGEVTFRFPLVVAPRYIPGQPLPGPNVGDGTACDTDAVPDASRISPPVLLPNYPNPVRLSLTVEVRPTQLTPRDFRCSLHSVFMKPDDTGGCHFQLQPGERLNRDFILRYQLGAEAVQTSLQLVPDPADPGQGTFLLTLLPPLQAGKPGQPRDVLFVLDRSGSMGGWKMVAARRALAHMVDSLTERDRFNVYAFDDRTETPPDFGPSLLEATSRNRSRALEFLGSIAARGGTEMAQPLNQAVEQLTGERDKILVLITDGQVGNEDQILRSLGQRLGNIRIFTLGIDQAVNEAFLKRLAGLGGGSCDVVESENRLDEVMYKVHRRIGTPALSQIQVDLRGLETEPDSLVPRRKLDLFAGVPVTLFGRYRGAPEGTAQVRATDEAGRPWAQTVAGRCSHHPAAGVLWARGRIRDLEDRFATGAGDPKELERVIVETSLRFSVLCRFTAYVAVDKSAVVNEGGRQHRIVQAVEAPAGWAMLHAPCASAPAALGAMPLPTGNARTLSTLLPGDDSDLDLAEHFRSASLPPSQASAPASPPPVSRKARSKSPGAGGKRGRDDTQHRHGDASRESEQLSRARGEPGPVGRVFRAIFGSGQGKAKKDSSAPAKPDVLTAYRKRAQELLDQLAQSGGAAVEERLRALGILAIKLGELLEDMRSILPAEAVPVALARLHTDLQALLGAAHPKPETIEKMWQQTETTLREFARPTP